MSRPSQSNPQGNKTPNTNVPKIQKAIPKPFARNSIDVKRSEKREWKHVQAKLLAIGDTVADVGKIETLSSTFPNVAGHNVYGQMFQIPAANTVFAFVRSDI